ncbi:MAG: D-alanyl-D-alanine carboxypeptidase family protein [Oscillospiraceae bacterium]|nr:D-alanyl-D-alanine carboxypeptidase family protein [Oscillospiraceae bacterium]MCR5305724.1 D-alanyl-D-alanine carboxypeptidase family protein [Oscillospiraceae bacterium]
MNRRFIFGPVAQVLTLVIIGIFAVDFFRRLWIDWGNMRGKLNVHSPSSSVTDIVPGTDATNVSSDSTVLTDLTGGSDQTGSESTSTTAATNPVPTDALTTDVQNADVHTGSLILVDADHPLAATPAMTPFSAIKYDHIRLPNRGLLVNNEIISPMVSMFNAFYASTGKNNLMVYATTQVPTAPEFQVSIPERAAGLSLDISVLNEAAGKHSGLTGEGEYAWMPQHAPEFGFVVRYTADKSEQTGMKGLPWHYRYVGVPHAQYMTEHALCLEEYLNELRTHTWDSGHLKMNYGGKDYEVYYVPASQMGSTTSIPYPAGMEPTVSGDNIDGFIVACTAAG